MTPQSRRMLRWDVLWPGDVLLSRSRDKFSALSSWATRNGNPLRRYSHAAIVLWGPSWFESNDAGVGYSYKRLSKMERHGNKSWRLIDLSAYAEFDVFRHPILESESGLGSQVDSDLLMDITSQWLGRQYPPLRRLTGATPWLLRFPRVKSVAVGIFDKFDHYWYGLPDIVAPGPFCSELVVRIYDELALKVDPRLVLFKTPRGSRRCSPNDLADPDISMLRLRPKLIVHEDQNIPDERTRRRDSELEDQLEEQCRAMQAGLVERVRVGTIALREAKSFSRSLNSWFPKKPR